MKGKLPLLISLPHAGLEIPPEVAALSVLTGDEIAADGDGGAREIYSGLEDLVAEFVTTDIARAFVDLNRPPDDFSRDGVIKTHTCYDHPVYSTPPSVAQRRSLLQKYYHPYHRTLVEYGGKGLRLAIDCHTMAAEGPPIGPDPGRGRPLLCLGNAGGGSCPEATFLGLASCLERAFGCRVSLNEPFRGGYITRQHCREMPWVQLEISRTKRVSDNIKAAAVQEALREWVAMSAG